MSDERSPNVIGIGSVTNSGNNIFVSDSYLCVRIHDLSVEEQTD